MKIKLDEPKFDKKEYIWWTKMFVSFFTLFLINIALCVIDLFQETVILEIIVLTPFLLSAVSAIFLGGIIREMVVSEKIPISIFIFCCIITIIFLYQYPKGNLFLFENKTIKFITTYLMVFLAMLFMVLFRFILVVISFLAIKFYIYIRTFFRNNNSN